MLPAPRPPLPPPPPALVEERMDRVTLALLAFCMMLSVALLGPRGVGVLSPSPYAMLLLLVEEGGTQVWLPVLVLLLLLLL